MASLIFISAAYLYAFWLLYLAIMNLYTAHKKGSLPRTSKVLGYPILALGLAFDVFANVTLFSIAFLEPPTQWLVTERLKKHINSTHWRGKLSRFICHNLLSPFDPSGDHCD